ncbi:TPA: ribonuclease HII, partial [Streptococcus suis]|nr:ribonuclease HII [Streptococcus suis]
MATIKEVTTLLAQVDSLDSPVWAELSQDERAGVQAAIKKRRKELDKEVAEDARLEAMLFYEKNLYENGVEFIAGID